MIGANSERIETSAAGLRPLLAWPFLLLAATIVALVLGGIAHIAHHQEQKEFARLQAIATLKVAQISAWLREREGDAPSLFVLVEKILGEGEQLPRSWPVAGTTGYDFLNLVNGLFGTI